MAKYVIRKTNGGQYWWILKAANGNTLLTSETYTTKQNCIIGIASSKLNVAESDFRRLSSVRNETYFTQNFSNYQVLGTSDLYNSINGRDNGIESAKQNAPQDLIEDLN